ncbi:MAG: hypothetical protein JWN10_2072 [Solirubrobacterales bacterium]|nr:hypothetical protein [Solirubrobacterales bacterium]
MLRGALIVAALLLAAGVYSLLTAHSDTHARQAATRLSTARRSVAATRPAAPVSPAPAVAPLVVTAPAHSSTGWTVLARVRGQPAAWLAQRSGVTLIRFDQGLTHLTLHAGSSDGGASGWTYGDRVTPREIHLLVAAVNGGFKLTYGDVGFTSGGHVAVPLHAGLASIVTYTDGTTDIGTWQAGVPSPSKRVFSVLQNQRLLVDRGVAAANVSSCIIACWGETIGGQTAVARSGLGITAGGQLVWAAGEQLLPADLATGLIGAGAVRAIELDINPDWVAGYLYLHHRGGPSAVPVVPGQLGIAGKLLEPYSRDFLAFVAS